MTSQMRHIVRHKSLQSYFLTLNILSFEDKILIKTYENVKDFLLEDRHKISYKIVFQKIKIDEH